MKIFLDCSDPDLISYAVETGLIDGITTNPSLMKKQGQDREEGHTAGHEEFGNSCNAGRSMCSL